MYVGPWKQVPLPCNYTGAPQNQLLRSCADAVPYLGTQLKERLKVQIRGPKNSGSGYYGGKILLFAGSGGHKSFPTNTCDVLSDETSSNYYGGGCGGRCTVYDAGDDNYYLDMGTCSREVAYLRGGWIRNISVQWRRIKDMMQTARLGTSGSWKGLPIPTLGWRSQPYAQAGFTDYDNTPLCQGIADDYINALNRIASSTVMATPAGAALASVTASQCAGVVSGSSQPAYMGPALIAACHLLNARNSLEMAFVYLAACVQFTFAMDAQIYAVKEARPYAGGSTGSLFDVLEGRMKSTCEDVDSLGEFRSCYNNNLASRVQSMLGANQYAQSYYKGIQWASDTEMPVTAGDR